MPVPKRIACPKPMPAGFERVPVRLSGEDGNAHSIMARVCRALRKAGYGQETLDAYTKQAMAGDYNNLLRVTLEYADDIGCDCDHGD